MFNLFFLKKILFFQPSCSNCQFCKLGTKKLPFLLTFFYQLSLQEGIFGTAASLSPEFISNMAKGRTQNGGNKNTKHAKFSEKRTFLPPDTHTYVCVSEGKKHKIWRALCSCYLRFEIRPFAILPRSL